MQKVIKKLLKGKLKIVFAITITIAILLLSLLKLPQYKINISNLDKWQHSFAYFILSISWLLVFYQKPNKKYIIVFLCILFGIIIEILQEVLTGYRTGDVLDILANSVGVIVGLLFFIQIYKKKWLN